MSDKNVHVVERFSVKGYGAADPYVNDIGTMPEAVSIAKSYQALSPDGFVARISREVNVTVGDVGPMSALTHEYGVTKDGQITLQRELNSDIEVIESAQKEHARQTRQLTMEEIQMWRERIKAAEPVIDALMSVCEGSRLHGFRFIFFWHKERFEDHLRGLVTHLVLKCGFDKPVLRYFEKDIDRLVERMTHLPLIPMVSKEDLQMHPAEACEAITGSRYEPPCPVSTH